MRQIHFQFQKLVGPERITRQENGKRMPWSGKKCPSCDKGFRKASVMVQCHSCDSFTHNNVHCLSSNSDNTTLLCKKCKPGEILSKDDRKRKDEPFNAVNANIRQ